MGCGAGRPGGQYDLSPDIMVQSDLAANSSECVLAMWHHPLFSSGWTGGSPGVAPLWDALSTAHADVVLGGHDHLYERYAHLNPSGTATSSGIREFVVGTGGESLNGLSSIGLQPKAHVEQFGVLVLTLRAGGSGSYIQRAVDGGAVQGLVLPQASRDRGREGQLLRQDPIRPRGWCSYSNAPCLPARGGLNFHQGGLS